MGKQMNWSEYAGYEVGDKPTVLILPEGEKEALACLLDRIIEASQGHLLEAGLHDPFDEDMLFGLSLLNEWLRTLRCWLTLNAK